MHSNWILPTGETVYAYLPAELRRPEPVIFVHGLGREAERLALNWAPMLDQIGRAGVFPLLTLEAYPEYQLLHHDDEASRKLLPRLLASAASRLGVSSDTCLLGGFSGGAQFTHRSLLFDLGITVPKAMVLSPGTYCFPTEQFAYPFGTPPEIEGAVGPDFVRLLDSQLLVAVGADDDGAPNTAPEIAALQGDGRAHRAARWTRALRDYAETQGIKAQITFRTIPNAAHSFETCLANGLADLLVTFLEGIL